MTHAHEHEHSHEGTCGCESNDGECHCNDGALSRRSPWQRIKPYRLLWVAFIGVLIFATIATATTGYYEWHVFMQYLMAGYFLIFGIMQTISLKKSAAMLQQYDTIAKKAPVYGFLYPILQIGLGLAYLYWVAPILVNAIAATVLFFTMIGIIDVLERKKKVRCGCLGKSMNVSVSWVTLVETVVMFVMAFGMLVYFFATMTPQSGDTEAGAQQSEHQHKSL